MSAARRMRRQVGPSDCLPCVVMDDAGQLSGALIERGTGSPHMNSRGGAA